MNLVAKYRSLEVWEKLGVIGSIASIIGLIVAFWPSEPKNNGSALTQSGINNAQIKNNSGIINISPSAAPPPVDIRTIANAMGTVASTRRKIVGNHIPIQRPPDELIDAEIHFQAGSSFFIESRFADAAEEFAKANKIYEMLLMKYDD